MTILTIPASSIGDQEANSNKPFGVTKTVHQSRIMHDFDLDTTGAISGGQTVTAYIAKGAESITAFRCMLTDTGTSTNIDFDLKINGTTTLSAVVNFVHGDTDLTVKDGTISGSGTLAADDVVTIVRTDTASTGATGPVCYVEIQHNNA